MWLRLSEKESIGTLLTPKNIFSEHLCIFAAPNWLQPRKSRSHKWLPNPSNVKYFSNNSSNKSNEFVSLSNAIPETPKNVRTHLSLCLMNFFQSILFKVKQFLQFGLMFKPHMLELTHQACHQYLVNYFLNW